MMVWKDYTSQTNFDQLVMGQEFVDDTNLYLTSNLYNLKNAKEVLSSLSK